MTGIDTRDVRRAFLRGAVALAIALVITVGVFRPLVTPAAFALIFIPISLSGAHPRVGFPLTFALAAFLSAAAFIQGVYGDAVLSERALPAGLRALDELRSQGAADRTGAVMAGVAACGLGAGFTLALNWRRRGADALWVFLAFLAAVCVASGVAAQLLGDENPAVAPVITLGVLPVVTACSSIVVVGVHALGDRIERAIWGAPASEVGA